MRRLPIYILLDTSISMQGDPIKSVEQGIKILLSSLRKNPFALETAYISIITFNHEAHQIVPLTELALFTEPKLEASGQTSLGQAITLLNICIECEVKKSSPNQKGDWKPLVFIMTDGAPTDDWKKALANFNKKECSQIIGCAAGEHAEITILDQIATKTVVLEDMKEETIKDFFKWVSTSIETVNMDNLNIRYH